MDPGLATYLSVGTQSLASGLGGLFTNNAIKKENQKNREWNEKMWNLTNEYNSPSAQMQRYQDAGLSPNLVYGSTQNSLASYAGNLQTSENFQNPLKDFRTGIIEGIEMRQQNDLVNSQLKVNQSIEERNLADAEETRSKIPINLQQKSYLEQLTQGEKNKNEFYSMSKDLQFEALKLANYMQKGEISQVKAQTAKIWNDIGNDNTLTEWKVNMLATSIHMQYEQLKLSQQELIGRLQLWAKQGDSSMLMAKSAFLNALTNSKEFDLSKQKFDKFSDVQLQLLNENEYKLRTTNGWLKIFLEQKANINDLIQDKGFEQLKSMKNSNDWFLINSVSDLF